MFYSAGTVHWWPHHAFWTSKINLSRQQLAHKTYFVILHSFFVLLIEKCNSFIDCYIRPYVYSFCSCTWVPLLRPWQLLKIFNNVSRHKPLLCNILWAIPLLCVHREHVTKRLNTSRKTPAVTFMWILQDRNAPGAQFHRTSMQKSQSTPTVSTFQYIAWFAKMIKCN